MCGLAGFSALIYIMVILENLKTARDTHDMGSSGVGLKAKNSQANTDNNTVIWPQSRANKLPLQNVEIPHPKQRMTIQDRKDSISTLPLL